MATTTKRLRRPGMVWIKCLMPSQVRWSFVEVHADGRIATSTIWILLKGRWGSHPDSVDPAWRARAFGPYVVAFRTDT